MTILTHVLFQALNFETSLKETKVEFSQRVWAVMLFGFRVQKV